MSVLDNAIQALFDMAHKEVLWTNASPTSTFREQSVKIRTLSNYDLIAIQYKSANISSAYVDIIVSEIIYNQLLACSIPSGIDSTTNYVQFNARTCKLMSNSLQFEPAYYKNSADYARVVNNALMIPLKIYGVKI